MGGYSRLKMKAVVVHVTRQNTQRRRTNISKSYPDSHQLFLANIPNHATEEDLKKLLGAFGRIVTLRICTSRITKNGLRYGFMIYEEESSAQTLLSKQPIYFQGQKLTVEKKRTSSDRLRVDQQGSLGSS